MRHKKNKYLLGVKKEHRKALLSNLATSLILHGRIKTTLTKAKALRPFVEKLITLAKKTAEKDRKNSLHLRRLALARINNKNAVRLLFNEQVSEFSERKGGYTRIYKLGKRIGDAAEMAFIEFVKASDLGYQKKQSKTRVKEEDNSPVKEEKVSGETKTESSPKIPLEVVNT